jgi:hypothetical protein
LVDDVGNNVSVLILLVFLHFLVLWSTWGVFLILSLPLLVWSLLFCWLALFKVLFCHSFFLFWWRSDKNLSRKCFAFRLRCCLIFFRIVKRWITKDPIHIDWRERSRVLKGKLNKIIIYHERVLWAFFF